MNGKNEIRSSFWRVPFGSQLPLELRSLRQLLRLAVRQHKETTWRTDKEIGGEKAHKDQNDGATC